MFVGYLALLCGGIDYFKAQRNAPALCMYIVLLTAALVAIVVFKGERPVRWRWGGK